MQKKKSLLGIAAAALLFVVVLGACSQPTDFTVKETGAGISGPANVTLKNVTGGVYITWDPVYDATAYEVWRKDTSVKGSSPEQLYKNQGYAVLSYADIISTKNPLKPATKYEYTILAVATSGNRSLVVQTGKTTKTITTGAADTFPAKGTVVPFPADLALTAEKGAVTLSLTPDENPAVSYYIEYGSQQSTLSVPSEYRGKVYTYDLTSFGIAVNTTSVDVYATLGDGIYFPMQMQTVSLSEVPALSVNFDTYSVSPVTSDANGYDTDTNYISFKFDYDATVTYTLSRQKVGGADGTGNNVGDWEVIPPANVVIATGVDVYKPGVVGRSLQYLVPEYRQKYNYRLVATKDGSNGGTWSSTSTYTNGYAPKNPVSANLNWQNVGYTYNASGAITGQVFKASNIDVPNGALVKGETLTLLGRKNNTNEVYAAKVTSTSTPAVAFWWNPPIGALSLGYYFAVGYDSTTGQALDNPNNYEWKVEGTWK